VRFHFLPPSAVAEAQNGDFISHLYRGPCLPTTGRRTRDGERS
jgi:hypothetical protein